MTDEASFDSFYRIAYPKAIRLAWLISNDASISEDAVQEVLAEMVERFDRIDNPAGYLRTSLINNLRRRGRRAQRERSQLQLLYPRSADLHSVDSIPELAHSIARLPRNQRIAIVCRYWEDLPEADIAKILRVRPATVRMLVSRAMSRLRLEIEP